MLPGAGSRAAVDLSNVASGIARIRAKAPSVEHWLLDSTVTPDGPLRCPAPACGGAMFPETAHGVTVDRCDRCGGIWFDAHELDRWLAAFYPDLKPTPEHRMPRRGIGGHPCPRCHKAMETAGWTELVLDRCPECHGIFAEAREVADLEQEPVPGRDGTFAIRLKDAMTEAGWTMLAARAIAILVMSVFG